MVLMSLTDKNIKGLNVLELNVRGLMSKTIDLSLLVEKLESELNDLDVILLCRTFLHKQYVSNAQFMAKRHTTAHKADLNSRSVIQFQF